MAIVTTGVFAVLRKTPTSSVPVPVVFVADAAIALPPGASGTEALKVPLGRTTLAATPFTVTATASVTEPVTVTGLAVTMASSAGKSMETRGDGTVTAIADCTALLDRRPSFTI